MLNPAVPVFVCLGRHFSIFVPACDCFQALQIYSKTVELGLPLEPSYVVERYLDAQRQCKGYCGHGRDIVAMGFAHGSVAS